ncbi:MAG: pyrimidine 5'-nucleotidase [Saprospiraceae bacterium]
MQRFKWLLFDIDNTLLDFSGAAKRAMFQTFIDFEEICTEEIYTQYQIVNHAAWEAFEQQQITAAELRPKRMRDLFSVLEKEIANPHIFSKRYLENLVLCSEYYAGVPTLLDRLKTKYQLAIITNGLKEVQRPRLRKLELINKFDSIVVSDEIGVAKPQLAFFEYALNSLNTPINKSEILVIGDSLNSDIIGGNNAGLTTCWISHQRENKSAIQPNFTINTVSELEKSVLTATTK